MEMQKNQTSQTDPVHARTTTDGLGWQGDPLHAVKAQQDRSAYAVERRTEKLRDN